ncbi:Fructan 6-exohydrolase [Pseudocercospora fuligena]|uniref:beta-fructofuranosidase n=1 Tax=Pseudocercospora fuligena TaxID=685502 RepID=A0A8H6RGX4_9PEZI|nr:Fructan 6-exohydrolase [Pseudocercospora fuligena]
MSLPVDQRLSVLSGFYRRPSTTQAAADAIPLLVDDEYQIFHLTTPPNTVHHPQRLRSSWSRIRSKDLVHWTRDQNPVITPTAFGVNDNFDQDADGAWTGSAVLDPHGNLRIFYTGYNLAKGGKQVILNATSYDRHGSKVTKTKGEIQITSDSDRSAFEDIDFRDPYIFFNEEDQLYWMLIATRLACGPSPTRGCIALLTSTDLDAWHLSPTPLYAPHDMICPECPELFSLKGKWYLIYSRFHAPDAGTVYRIADSPSGPFRVPKDGSHGRLDGRRWYAAKSCGKVENIDKRIFFGWVADWNADDGKWLWGGDLALPREVSANEDGTLRIRPAIDLNQGALLQLDIKAKSPEIMESVLVEAVGRTRVQRLVCTSVPATSTHILEFTIVDHDCVSFGLIFRPDKDHTGFKLRCTPSPSDGFFTATIEYPNPPLDDFWADQYKLYLPRQVDGPEIVRHDHLRLREPVTIYAANDTVEVFLGGRSMTFRMTSKLGQDPAAVEELYAMFVKDGKVELGGMKMTVLDPPGATLKNLA